MKNREELLTEIYEDESAEDTQSAIYVAVDSSIYAALEYIDDAIEKYGHYEVLGKVLGAVRNNVVQLGRNG